ncbi:Crp/Fnr family transcriptional regulator [Cohnella faecalis]|uniref:Crp/Fnr family transcriptional regulator n=1 Tax=Cohnella faecalis TaxID=2315694 RepID=A0A398CWZ7_9BACL|nr:Crp/Fnr family transcriptional regulator [Cohnella faecalis]RIE04357.1 Crp/Fnr family transcriptional regulator [Cohnella faecalis]
MISESLTSRVLDSFPCLSAVTAEEWNEAQPTVRTFPAKSCIFQRKDASSYGMFLLSGTARISRIAEDGGESVISILKAGEVCALLVLSGLSDRDYPGALTAESEVEALFVAKQSFLNWLQTHAEIRSVVFGGLLDNLLSISVQYDGRRLEPLDGRLAKALLRTTSEQKQLLNMTHHELAVEIGSAREVVSRALRRYRQRGWIETGRGWIRIVRREELESMLGD